ncbi:putative methyltransferase DDB_G0268948 [Folsomia candida]|uniref:Putative S-adenosylmethionine-dependent methyltransferase CRG1 n=1 Tax=Folsomia candida TaxID=158441 RepID=A0A226EHG7_FOLCA|nr:putative methyltransferase DDB_G0268948 [Folsomia candida]OXA56750.1 putative S-adenosylmethionine-dependent methyltransferase CRG1 [Folsomia candida]
MSFRQFEEPSHASLYRKYREKPPEHLIERIIQFLKEKYSGPLNLVVDLGCGSGQCTFFLAKYFNKVLGTDISEAQINEALEESSVRKCDNIEFRVSRAEEIALADKSVQLITACVSAHWFDLEKVYEEGRRVLCPGGVMAFLCMDGLIAEQGNDLQRNLEFANIMEYANSKIEPYYAPPVAHAFNKYRDITIPYDDLTREYGYEMSSTANLSMILGAIRSFSAFQTLCKVKGLEEGESFIQQVKTRFLDVANVPNDNINENVFTIKRRYFVVMARV